MQSRHLTHFAMTVSRLALAMSITLVGTAALAVGQDTTEHTAHHPADVSSAVKTMPAKSGQLAMVRRQHRGRHPQATSIASRYREATGRLARGFPCVPQVGDYGAA